MILVCGKNTLQSTLRKATCAQEEHANLKGSKWGCKPTITIVTEKGQLEPLNCRATRAAVVLCVSL